MLRGKCYQQQKWERRIYASDSGLSVGTPTARMSTRSGKFAEGRVPTPAEMAMWHTPCAQDAKHATLTQWERDNKGPYSLTAQVLWTTLSSSDGERGGTITENMTGTSLAQQVNTPEKWPTPRAQMHKGTGPSRTGCKEDLQTKVGGQLNPPWVEWLMGWPIGWTDLEPLAMDKFRLWLQQHSGF